MLEQQRASGRGAEPDTARPHSSHARSLVVYVVLAFSITWAVWVPRALSDQGVIDSPTAQSLGAVWAYGPALAAVAAAAVLGGRRGLRQLGRRLVRWRVGWTWWGVVLAGPAALWALVAALHVSAGGSASEVEPLAVESGVAGAAILLIVLCLTDGLGEETGWRGYALPRLLALTGAFAASLLLGVVWALWHLPLFWTDGASLEGASVLLLMVDLPAMAVLYTWVFQHTGGSAATAIVLHATSNLFAVAPPSAGESLRAYLLALGVKLAVVAVLLIATDPRTLRRRGDTTDDPLVTE